MTLDDWIGAAHPAVLAGYALNRAAVRRRRVYACGCGRRAWDRLSHPDSRAAVEAAERFLAGEVGGAELARAAAAARAAAGEAPVWAERQAAELAAWAASPAVPAGAAKRFYQWHAKELLVEVFGNPLRPPAFAPAWRTAAALALARAMDGGGDYSVMPILADALEEAGCEDAEILGHCRADAPHMRGCWVVEMVLGLS